jgi:tetratricopeptide (TPR) repeat protein
MSVAEEYNRFREEGFEWAKKKEWAQAGLAFCKAATAAYTANRYPEAAVAWDAGGEALRRADQPGEALKAFEAALRFSSDENAAAVAIKLAAAASDIGDFELGRKLLEEAAKESKDTILGFVALDSLAGILLATGEIAALRSVVKQLTFAPGALRIGSLFRSAQLARLDGDFATSRQLLLSGREALDPIASPAGVAGIEGELAELAELEGIASEANESFQVAIDKLGEAARLSLAYRMRAARVRAMVAAGLEVMGQPLNTGIRYAEARRMPILGIDLHLARGMATASYKARPAQADFEHVIRAAEKYNAPFRRGRAQVELARMPGPLPARIQLLEEAEQHLASNRPWLWRARFLKVTLQDEKPHQALKEFTAMGMSRDAAAAQKLCD